MSPKAINAVTKSGDTALTWAANKGWDEVCKMLTQKMSTEAINAVNNDDETALTLAVKNGHETIVKLLKTAMSPPDINETVISSVQELQVKAKTLQNDAKFEAKAEDVSMFGQLLTAIKMDKAVAIPIIIRMNKQELTAIDEEGKTALHHAAKKDNAKVVTLLLEKNPDLLNIEDNSNNTALLLAKAFECQKAMSAFDNFMSKVPKTHGEQLAQVQVEANEGIAALLELPIQEIMDAELVGNSTGD